MPAPTTTTTTPCLDTAYFHSWNHVSTGSVSVSSHSLFRGLPRALSSSSASVCVLPSTPHHGLTTTSDPNAFHCTIFRLYSVLVVHVPSYFHLLSCDSYFPQPEHSSTHAMPLDPLVDQYTSQNFSSRLDSSLLLQPYREVRGLAFPRRNVPREVLVQ